MQRSIVTGNETLRGGSALSLGVDEPAQWIVNSLIAENIVSQAREGASAAAIQSSGILRLIHSTVASNVVNGTVSGAAISGFRGNNHASHIRLLNSLIVNNLPHNCAGRVVVDGGNLQFPGERCGEAMTQADPELRAMRVGSEPPGLVWDIDLAAGPACGEPKVAPAGLTALLIDPNRRMDERSEDNNRRAGPPPDFWMPSLCTATPTVSPTATPSPTPTASRTPWPTSTPRVSPSPTNTGSLTPGPQGSHLWLPLIRTEAGSAAVLGRGFRDANVGR